MSNSRFKSNCLSDPALASPALLDRLALVLPSTNLISENGNFKRIEMCRMFANFSWNFRNRMNYSFVNSFFIIHSFCIIHSPPQPWAGFRPASRSVRARAATAATWCRTSPRCPGASRSARACVGATVVHHPFGKLAEIVTLSTSTARSRLYENEV